MILEIDLVTVMSDLPAKDLISKSMEEFFNIMWKRIAIDITGAFPKSRSGHRFLLDEILLLLYISYP